jgi:hypothetical protein
MSRLNATSVLLLALAGLPWIFPYLKGMKLPGGIELEFREIKDKIEKMDAAVSVTQSAVVHGVASKPRPELAPFGLRQRVSIRRIAPVV